MNIRMATMDDLKEIASIEAECFPPEEAASEERLKERLVAYANHFWLLFDQEKLVGFINGMVSDEPHLRDEMYEDATLHVETGKWQMIFGVNTIPAYRGKGLAEIVMRKVIKDARSQQRLGLVLTCKENLIHYYEKFGFQCEGVSQSKHGGMLWYELRLKFSSQEDLKTMERKKWLGYQSNLLERNALSTDLKESWERALKSGIDASKTIPMLVPEEERIKSKSENKRIFVCTQSLFHATKYVMKEKENFSLLLFSKEGMLLSIYHEEQMNDWINQHHIKAWTNWSENQIGPNIFSVGIQRKTGTTMIGAENYLETLIDGAWYFSPIFDGHGDILGGLALVCALEFSSEYLEYLVYTLSKNIELHFAWFGFFHNASSVTEGMGFMSLDQSTGENRILTMGEEIFKMLGIKDEGNYVYQKLEHYIDPLPANAEFWHMVQRNVCVSDKTIRLICRGKSSEVCISTSIFKEPTFHIDGLVIVFNSHSRIQRLVAKFNGSVAHFTFDSIIGQSSSFIDVINHTKNASLSESSILLLGESGTGKDVLAQAIHNGSYRHKGPFVAINCASFSKELIASELFGYVEGAFTGARRGGSIGKFEMADNGTLFLDEIGDMPLDLQAVLLRTLEERCFMKVGGNELRQTNTRIIAATNKNLTEKMRNGLFREDLYYRLSVVRINLPPLRQRGEDILLLSDSFLKSICERQNKSSVTLTLDAKEFLLKYHWPGNIRELSHLLEGLVSIRSDNLITSDAIIKYLGQEDLELNLGMLPLRTYSSELEQMKQALRETRGNRCKAAAVMGMSRSTFYRRLKIYNLEENMNI